VGIGQDYLSLSLYFLDRPVVLSAFSAQKVIGPWRTESKMVLRTVTKDVTLLRPPSSTTKFQLLVSPQVRLWKADRLVRDD